MNVSLTKTTHNRLNNRLLIVNIDQPRVISLKSRPFVHETQRLERLSVKSITI